MTFSLAQNTDHPQTELDSALQYHNAGQFQQAEKIYQTILGRDSTHADALHLLGVLTHQTGDHHQAVGLIENAIRINPSNPFYYCNLGVVYHALNLLESSILCYQKALALSPDNPDAFNNLANIFKTQGRLNQAAEMYQKVLSLQPDDAVAYNSLGHIYRVLGSVKDEISCYRKALQVDPEYAQTYLNLGNVLQYHGELDQAIVCYQNAIQKNSNFGEAYNNFGSALLMQGRLNEAGQCYKKALAINPCYAEAFNNLGSINLNQGKFKEGIICFRKALEIKPNYAKAHSNLLYTMHYKPGIKSPILFEEARQWWQQHGINNDLNDSLSSFQEKDGRIKIGYISPDFREHSVSYFFLPFLKYHNSASFEIFCYSEVKREDNITNRIKELSDNWRSISWLSDRAVADQVRRDRIHILVDLAGHTSENRLLVFAHRPAPVQVTWLGYPGTTGMPVIDYRLTDDIADPPGESDKYHSESLIRLPQGFLCYGPPKDAPEVSGLPARRNGCITFGSFNNLPKINPEVIGLWSRLLHQVVDSRLVLKSKQFADEHVRQRFLALFFDCGVAAERVTLLPRVASTAGHLSLYHQVDIGLDPFPYNGTTTTCEALWMGVPVITLRGDRHAGRVGASILTRLGLGDMVAEDEDKYVGIGIKLAQDINALATLRSGMRSRMQSSGLCDGKSFARTMEDTYQKVWQTWRQTAICY
jgi:predicted O-linked N-acetylglucosamine transferase (SPINDLY family)